MEEELVNGTNKKTATNIEMWVSIPSKLVFQFPKVGVISFPISKGGSDPKVYLSWESACERLFQVNDLIGDKKSCYTVAHFEGYANTWWEYTTRFGNLMNKGQPHPWVMLKGLMRILKMCSQKNSRKGYPHFGEVSIK
ncbi:hypothetical protein BC332_21266 [Capsicum chinense]|nr:hypothetical protein BC332_21266 [Capsicum chinense]